MILAIALAAVPLQSSGTFTITVTPDPTRAPVDVHVPIGISAGNPRPLVIGLHSYGANGDRLEFALQFGSFQASDDFIYCTPLGTVITQTPTVAAFWDASPACCNLTGTPVDDVAFLLALIGAVQQATHVDARRVHLIGYSNGAFMAQELARQHPDEIASFVSINGTMADTSLTFGGPDPVSMLHIHGEDDGAIPYTGGTWSGLAPFVGAVELAERWASHNGCGLVRQTSLPVLDLDANISFPWGPRDSTVTRFTGPCLAGSDVELWTILDGMHSVAMTPQMRRGMLDFLLEHPAPGVVSSSFCSPAALNSQGTEGAISALGSDVIVADSLSLQSTGLIPNELGMFLASNSAATPANGLCLGSPILRLDYDIFQADPSGTAVVDVDLGFVDGSLNVMPGVSLYFQSWSRDPAAASGQPFQYSNGVGVTLH